MKIIATFFAGVLLASAAFAQTAGGYAGGASTGPGTIE